jgi:hypothetical protein
MRYSSRITDRNSATVFLTQHPCYLGLLYKHHLCSSLVRDIPQHVQSSAPPRANPFIGVSSVTMFAFLLYVPSATSKTGTQRRDRTLHALRQIQDTRHNRQVIQEDATSPRWPQQRQPASTPCSQLSVLRHPRKNNT